MVELAATLIVLCILGPIVLYILFFAFMLVVAMLCGVLDEGKKIQKWAGRLFSPSSGLPSPLKTDSKPKPSPAKGWNCPKCKTSSDYDALFCDQCGTALSRR